MSDFCGRSALHGGTSGTDGDGNDFGARPSKIMFKNCHSKAIGVFCKKT